MKFELVYTKRAVKDIQRLDERTKQRLKSALEFFADSPLKYSEKLINSEIGSYRFRVGDYRVIFDMYKNKIVVLRVGHRKEIYRTK